METGFLNPIHDEEHFSSSFYNQGNGLDDTEHILFGEMIVPEVIDYDNLWHSVDDMGTPSPSGDAATLKEDFQKMLFEWQHQLSYMQEPEAIKQIVPVAEKTTQEVSDMFSSRTSDSSTPTAPSIDELFPLEPNKDAPLLETYAGETRVNHSKSIDNVVAAVQVKKEREEEKWRTVQVKIEPDYESEEVDVLQCDEVDTLQGNEVDTVQGNDGDVSEGNEVNTVQSNEVNAFQGNEVGTGDAPLLLAGDLTSLLEQFEATEKVNSIQPMNPVSPSPPRPSNQTIRDALPAEVIKRIKATRENHKKMISVIPAMPTKRPGRAATRMQDAGATLSRNKLLKLVTGGSNGESVQLDHDYCTSGDTTSSSSTRSYYVSDSSEYPSQSSTPDALYSRMPDYYMALAPQKTKDRVRAADSGSRKDSGLESGENSEDDLQPVKEVKNKVPVVLKSVAGLKSINVVTENGVVIGSAPVKRNNVPMVSVLKKNNVKVENDQTNINIKVKSEKVLNPSAIPIVSECSSVASSTQIDIVHIQEVSKKKKKLNLEEYRVRREERDRIRSQESSRANSPVPCVTPPTQPDSTTTGTQEGAPKEKPLMFSVEVQTQTCDFVDLTSKSDKEYEKFRMDRKEKRNDLKYRSYRARHASSSSSSSANSDRHHSRRRKKRSRSNRRRSSVSRMWSRSPSRSSSRSHSITSSRSRSRSRPRDRRQKWRSRSPRRSNNRYNNSKGFHSRDNRDRGWQRSRSPVRSIRGQEFGTQEKVRQVEERRVIYVGRIEEGTTKADLRRRFQQFGTIVDISVHFRERGDNYGFVTFAYKADAYKAVEHGNDDPKLPHYDLCFGGRRAFCKQRYADLDGLATSIHNQYGTPLPQQRSTESFDLLLHEVKAQLRKRSSV